jgi:hypothetical protein
MMMILTSHYKYQLVKCVYFKGLMKFINTDGKMTKAGSIHHKHSPKWLVMSLFYPYHHRTSCFYRTGICTMNLQGDSRGALNTLGGDRIGHFKKKII